MPPPPSVPSNILQRQELEEKYRKKRLGKSESDSPFTTGSEWANGVSICCFTFEYETGNSGYAEGAMCCAFASYPCVCPCLFLFGLVSSIKDCLQYDLGVTDCYHYLFGPRNAGKVSDRHTNLQLAFQDSFSIHLYSDLCPFPYGLVEFAPHISCPTIFLLCRLCFTCSVNKVSTEEAHLRYPSYYKIPQRDTDTWNNAIRVRWREKRGMLTLLKSGGTALHGAVASNKVSIYLKLNAEKV